MDLELAYLKNPDGSKKLTIPEERRAAAIAYVKEGGANAPAEIARTVQEGHDALMSALGGVSDADARHKPGPDDWCVLELMAHVVSTKRIVVTLCTNLAEGHWPPWFNVGLEDESRQDGVTFAHFDTLTEARDAAETAHRDLLAFIQTLDGSVNTEIKFKHFVFGEFNCREWALFQRIHDDNHTPQLLSIKASAAAATA